MGSEFCSLTGKKRGEGRSVVNALSASQKQFLEGNGSIETVVVSGEGNRVLERRARAGDSLFAIWTFGMLCHEPVCLFRKHAFCCKASLGRE